MSTAQAARMGMGTDAKRIEGEAHLKQSINTILSTPIGSRVMRREFGSHLHQLLGMPLNAAGILRLQAATASALMRWEPRLKIQRIDIQPDNSGKSLIIIIGKTTLGESFRSSFALGA